MQTAKEVGDVKQALAAVQEDAVSEGDANAGVEVDAAALSEGKIEGKADAGDHASVEQSNSDDGGEAKGEEVGTVAVADEEPKKAAEEVAPTPKETKTAKVSSTSPTKKGGTKSGSKSYDGWMKEGNHHYRLGNPKTSKRRWRPSRRLRKRPHRWNP